MFVSDIKLPTVFLFGKEYTARQRNTLIKEILSSRFYDPNFKMEVNFQEFISNKNFLEINQIHFSLSCDEYFHHMSILCRCLILSSTVSIARKLSTDEGRVVQKILHRKFSLPWK